MQRTLHVLILEPVRNGVLLEGRSDAIVIPIRRKVLHACLKPQLDGRLEVWRPGASQGRWHRMARRGVGGKSMHGGVLDDEARVDRGGRAMLEQRERHDPGTGLCDRAEPVVVRGGDEELERPQPACSLSTQEAAWKTMRLTSRNELHTDTLGDTQTLLEERNPEAHRERILRRDVFNIDIIACARRAEQHVVLAAQRRKYRRLAQLLEQDLVRRLEAC